MAVWGLWRVWRGVVNRGTLIMSTVSVGEVVKRYTLCPGSGQGLSQRVAKKYRFLTVKSPHLWGNILLQFRLWIVLQEEFFIWLFLIFWYACKQFYLIFSFFFSLVFRLFRYPFNSPFYLYISLFLPFIIQ